MQIGLRGDDAALAMLEGLPLDITTALEAEAGDIVAPLREQLATYPPEREGQIYVRTYDLQAGWQNAPVQVQFIPDGVTLAIENPVVYTPDVQQEPQDPYFVNRWATTAQITSDQEPVVTDRIESALGRLGRGH